MNARYRMNRRAPRGIRLVRQSGTRPQPQIIPEKVDPPGLRLDKCAQMNPRDLRILMMGEMKIEIPVNRRQPRGHLEIVSAVIDVARAERVVDVDLRRPRSEEHTSELQS